MESTISFRVKEGEAAHAEYIKLEEGRIENGIWKPGRILNGDEKMAIKLGDKPIVYMIELYKF